MNPLLPLYPLLIWAFLSPGLALAQSVDIQLERTYHANGQLIQKYAYRYDYWSEQKVKHGAYSQWSAKGRLQEEAVYQDGQLAGVRKTYYASGQLKQEMHYVQGQADGLMQGFRSDGSLKQKGYFRSGKRHGTFVWYGPQGQVKRQVEYVHGHKQ